MVRKPAASFERGNGSSGMGTPSAAHSGSHPSAGRHSTSRVGAIAARTAALWRSYAAWAGR
jgi:hypothetical protein